MDKQGNQKWRASRTMFMLEGRAVQVTGTGNTRQEATSRLSTAYEKRKQQLSQYGAGKEHLTLRKHQTSIRKVVEDWLKWENNLLAAGHPNALAAVTLKQYGYAAKNHV